MDLELAAGELKTLATRERLSPSELDRVKYLMVELKRSGMSNPEIVELTGERWSESTIKGYTKGIRAADPEPWQSAAARFSETLSRGLTLADVERALDITTELETMGTSLSDVVGFVEDLKSRQTNVAQLTEAINLNAQLERMGTSPSEIASFLQELRRENIDAAAFVSLYCDWHQTEFTPEAAQSVLGYKAQLEDAGFNMDTLPQIAEAAGKFGSPGEVLEAVAKYASLGELEEEAQTKRKQLEALGGEMDNRNQELSAAGQKLEEARNETAAVEKAVVTYQRLEAMGFDEKVLGELAKAAEKYGTPRKVLRAINKFVDLTKIKTTEDELKTKVKRKRQMVKSLDEQYSHLREPIELCKKLIKRKFGLQALSLINATAWRYGEPTEVMKAIETYGQLKEIRKVISQAKGELAEIEGKIEALKETYADYSARNTAMLDQFEELNAKAIKVGRAVGGVQEQMKDDGKARDILNLLENPGSASYEEYTPLVLVLLKSISVWANMNKDKLRFSSLVDKNLQEVAGYLGGS